MSWKELIAMPFALASTAAVVGIGALAWSIGQTWEPRNTDSLIVGLSGACIAGGVVVAGILGVMIGVPLFIRMLANMPRRDDDDDFEPGAWGAPPPRMLGRGRGRTIDGDWDRLPGDARPLLPDYGGAMPPQYGQPGAGYGAPYGGGYNGVSLDGLDGDNRFGME